MSTDHLTYTYDNAGRLTGVSRNGQRQAAYAYDANSNRTTTTYGQGQEQQTVPATFDARDRMVTYGDLALSYNDDGELTGKQNTATGGAETFSYSTFGQLTGATTASGKALTYAYDGLGNLVAKETNGSLTRGFLYAPGITGPVSELGADGVVRSSFIYGTRPNVPDYMVRGGRSYRLITDQVGSLRLVVEAESGSVEQEIEYDAFGRVLSDSNPGFQPFGFAGGLHDQDTGLTHFGAREYDAELGRWTSSDPISFAGGDANLYGYVVGDPVNYVDPSGLSVWGDIGGTISEIPNTVEWWVDQAKSHPGTAIAIGVGAACVFTAGATCTAAIALQSVYGAVASANSIMNGCISNGLTQLGLSVFPVGFAGSLANATRSLVTEKVLANAGARAALRGYVFAPAIGTSWAADRLDRCCP